MTSELVSSPMNACPANGPNLPSVVSQTGSVVERLKAYGNHSAGGVISGQGVAHYGNGLTYEGGFKDGRNHGRGKLTSADGYSYDGEWSAVRSRSYSSVFFAGPVPITVGATISGAIGFELHANLVFDSLACSAGPFATLDASVTGAVGVPGQRGRRHSQAEREIFLPRQGSDTARRM